MKFNIFYSVMLSLFVFNLLSAGQVSKFEVLKDRISSNIQLVGKNLQLPTDLNQRNLLINDLQKKLKDNLGINNAQVTPNIGEKLNIIEAILHDALQVLFCSVCDINSPDLAGKVDFKNRIEWLKNTLVIFSADISNFNNRLNGLNPRLNCQETRDLSLDYLRAFSIQILFMRQFIDQAANNTICTR